MLNKNLIKKYYELERLNSNLDDLYYDIKIKIKSYEKQGIKISKQVKDSIKNMVYYIDNYNSYILLQNNYYYILRSLHGIKSKDQEELYIKLINIITRKINKNYSEDIFDSNSFTGYSIFQCLNNFDEISKEELIPYINEIISILENSNSKFKVKSGLILLNSLNKLKDATLIQNLINNIKNIDNEKKLEQIYIILSSNEFNFSKNVNRSIEEMLGYIKIEQDEKYDEKLTKILKILSNPRIIRNIDPLNNNIVELILETNLKNYDNENMEVIIKLLNKNFIFSDNWFLRNSIVENALDAKFINDEHKNLYIQAINDVVLSSNDLDDSYFKQQAVELLSKIKSPKSLELIIDIYPVINKYNNNEEKYDFINSLYNDDNNNEKKLIISYKNKYKKGE